MKKLLAVVLALVVVAGFAFAAPAEDPLWPYGKLGDARARGLGGAMTAVGDDSNALYYNPAGLAFIRKGFLDVDMNMDIFLEAGSSGEPTPAWIDVTPRVILGGTNWALEGFADYLAVDYIGDMSILDVQRRIGLLGGVGFNLGPVALGANIGYAKDATYYADMTTGPATLFMPDTLSPDFYDGYDPVLSVGLGSLFTLGSLNIGVYNSNIMPFLNESMADVPFFEAFMDTMNVGLSWMPSDNKFREQKFPLVLMMTADIKNFGDDYNRLLAAGIEAGLNLGEFIVVLGRLGYRQYITGPIGDANIDPNLAFLNVGATAKLWFAKVDVTVGFPGTMFTSGPDSGFPGAQLDLTTSFVF